MQGNTVINESVFVEIAREAMQKVEDVFKQDKKGGLSGITRIFTDRFTPHIAVKKTESAELDETEVGSVDFEVKLTVVYGVKIPEVAQKVRDKIISEVETFTGYKVDKVDIVIEKIVKPEEEEEEEEEKVEE
ncbi:MAG TPA: Asp23/Gls24 family envelope stress response protein [Thermoanaerobacterales bacterium]|nr:Asp23/Gls24 family envelope stress response protein [Thermoanaerobacterales bacterium]